MISVGKINNIATNKNGRTEFPQHLFTLVSFRKCEAEIKA